MRSRRYAEAASVQNLGTAWQAEVLQHTVDLDIENCSFTLLLQMLDKLKPQDPSWSDVRETLRECVEFRTFTIQNKLKLNVTAGKQLLQKVFNGSAPPGDLTNNEFIIRLQRASLFCRWVAASCLKDIAWASMLQFKEKPDLSVLTYFWNIAEDMVLESWLRKANPLQSKHTSLHFDGIRLDRDVVLPDTHGFCDSCSAWIEKDTGFKVKIRAKEHLNFLQLLQKAIAPQEVACPDNLQKNGNCILAALHHLGYGGQAATMAAASEGTEHAFFTRRQRRTYEQVSKFTQLPIFPRMPCTEFVAGQKFLLHLATAGQPHCLAAQALSLEQVQLTNVTATYKFSMADFSRMLTEATDRKYIQFFYVEQKPDTVVLDANEAEYELLLETQAGANHEDDGEDNFAEDFVRDVETQEDAEDDEPEDALQCEDESVTHVGDELLVHLKQEVQVFLTGGRRRKGRSADTARCPFCPFRAWPKIKRGRVLHHVQTYHCLAKQYVASGTKQLKLIIALHDFDQIVSAPKGNYLYRSSRLLRQTVSPALSRKQVLIDRFLRLVFTEEGPQFWSVDAVRSHDSRHLIFELIIVLTCRGRTNAVVLLQPGSSDDTEVLVRMLADSLPAQGLCQIKYLSVDNPSAKLYKEAKHVCPNLQVVALDPTHLAMTCEYASSRKRTAATRYLRIILRKLTARSELSAGTWGPIFCGENATPFTREEQRVRAQLADRSMRKAEAERILANLDATKPFLLRLEWIQALAALTSIYRSEVERLAPGPNRKIYQLLHTATAANRTEWFFNNLRLRHMISSERLSLLPIGTASNEALHHEVNNWFRETQKLHKATLSLKLSIMQLGKLLTHNNALYKPTTRQMPEAELLARLTSKDLFRATEWEEWCSELVDGSIKGKAELQLHHEREIERKKVNPRSFKRPAAAEDSSLLRRRTPNTLLRQDSLRRAGVRPRKL
ncbi:unnamed protein product [Symbiodinium natans]|uniref:Uncharacterized protein n=1 Tax=Symbiodinium natans TaxID=878477 RepID=A0A812R5S1_9DINO|nr:unnamed protein product [Symbiodinium natans]